MGTEDKEIKITPIGGGVIVEGNCNHIVGCEYAYGVARSVYFNDLHKDEFNAFFHDKDYIEGEQYTYCPICGHKIDWKKIKEIYPKIFKEEDIKLNWISVKDRLPEDCINVLTYNVSLQEYKICYFSYLFDFWMEAWTEYSERNEILGESNVQIDFWMPLAAPPKLEELE